MQAGVNVLDQVFEGLVNLRVRDCGNLHAPHIFVLLAELLGLLLGYLPRRWITLNQVHLVTD